MGSSILTLSLGSVAKAAIDLAFAVSLAVVGRMLARRHQWTTVLAWSSSCVYRAVMIAVSWLTTLPPAEAAKWRPVISIISTSMGGITIFAFALAFRAMIGRELPRRSRILGGLAAIVATAIAIVLLSQTTDILTRLFLRVGLRDLVAAVVFLTIGVGVYRFARASGSTAMRICAVALIMEGLQQLHYGTLFAVGVTRGRRVDYIDQLWLLDCFIHVVLGVGMVAAHFEEQMRVQTRSLAVLRRAKESLAHAQKMEAIGRLASGVAHDFNNVLTAIMSYGDEIESGLPRGSRLAIPARGIRDSATRAAGLVRQLLSFSKRKSNDEVILPLNSIVDRAVEMLRRTIGEHVALETAYGQSLKNVRLERDRMIEVVVNLIVNARDAMPNGGTITVKTYAETVTSTTAGAADHLGEFICVEVIDNGIGMSPEVRSRIFEPFFTTKEQGTGLGLSMVYGFVQRMQGFIDVQSNEGSGTTIKLAFPAVDLPATPESREAIVDPPSRSTETGSRNVHVLLVEDEPEIREVMRRSLAKHGIVITLASDGKEGLRAFAEAPQSFDLLLTDVIMPMMGGIELARHCREIRAEVPIVFVSGYAVDLEEFSGDACATRFVQKPFQPVALAEVVMSLLTRKNSSKAATTS